MKPQTVISIVLIILGFLFYSPYVYIMTAHGINDIFSIVGMISILTIILGICVILLGKNYSKLTK